MDTQNNNNVTPPQIERVEVVHRTISPYNLTAVDNPGAIISHPLLKGNNYDEWSCSLKTVICSRKTFGFVDGSIPKPASQSPYFEDWIPFNALLVSWIKITIDPTIKSNISHRDNDKDLWDHLKKRFSVTSGPQNQQVKVDLANCKQQGLSVEAYYGKLSKIWDHVDNSRPLCVCTYGKCLYNLTELQEKDRDEDRVQQFLYGLDDTHFQNIRSSLTARVPLPSLEEAYNIVRQEEDLQQNNRSREDTHEIAAFAAQTRFCNNTDKRTRKGKLEVCKHCNRGGHRSETGYTIFGYPESWGERSRSRVSHPGRNRGKDHANHPSPAYAHVVTTDPSSTEHDNHVVTDRDRDAVSGLSDEQWRSVHTLLNANKAPPAETFSCTTSSPTRDS